MEGINRNPEWNYKYHMTVDCVTEDMIKYFLKDALCFKVYGTPTNEKFRRQITLDMEKPKKKEPVKPEPSKGFKKDEEEEKHEDVKKTKEDVKDTIEPSEGKSNTGGKEAKDKSGKDAKDKSGLKTTETTTKVKKNQKVIKMVTPDGQTVEVVKEKNGCCTIF